MSLSFTFPLRLFSINCQHVCLSPFAFLHFLLSFSHSPSPSAFSSFLYVSTSPSALLYFLFICPIPHISFPIFCISLKAQNQSFVRSLINIPSYIHSYLRTCTHISIPVNKPQSQLIVSKVNMNDNEPAQTNLFKPPPFSPLLS